jgi:hypothetical protein
MEHPKRTLFHLLDGIDGIVYTNYPATRVNWETMKIDTINGLPAVCRAHVFQHEEAAVNFIKNNKHQIVVWEFFIPAWVEEDGVFNDPRPIIRYAKKPGIQYVN